MASKTIVPYFTEDELRCKCGCGALPEFTAEAMEFLMLISHLRDAAGTPFIVNSYYRCPLHDLYEPGSAHAVGLGIDIRA